MKRSALWTAAILATLCSPCIEAAAQDRKMLRVGDVSLGAITLPTRAAFLARMAELGYRQGRNFKFEYIQIPDRAAFGRAYQELVSRKVDILIAGGNETGLKSALAATAELPIAMIAIDYDPLARGYISSLARPGGNITGLVFQQIDLTRKRLQLMQEAFPDVKGATVFWDWASADQWKGLQPTATALGYPVQGVKLHTRPYDYEQAITEVKTEFRGALMVLASPIWKFPARRVLPDFALRHRIRTMFFTSTYVKAGGLMSYGVNFPTLFRRLAEYVDRIAKGAKPANLPVEQPRQFELAINLKTAKALNISIPPSILLRADKVIE